ncbi:hypothetical protein A3B21_01940 [Candidatus Uhrbacteria bacterium RIFCSPLOWO2_01_FULL_47_24]|uniref:Uncharacterized protein n=1 Tax=Candidatus Uhrbacteria bacterium RIFCSPLOWO2_01_FULL_47_24 TaxID=1802401 RepID=A0A1F7UPB9_9BACT|nr:MAG: hypothetical protein A2753_01690 [Candidatus Uhrbacteria bacterium RIFCSPHIGHO2_01_FULL_47_11]OGL67930.1 MAG: hypothetical protein A3D58_05135 [Candidatus Uhrbacteria bacterium RIFCSPHIGHO2_02_FULL_46_47]OGL75201.1 MAG: hypothetical protein A3F52_04125 [Candidatus Uhrbacteria bacterium RIFCSPHIGHO2_12_FULL_47_11]OGL80116.1 MAG: hypothetical protein A3B21_01940 [Candidatus Uhrbacteria bacterium RIFCSPLOWO2_01_FULL_47_24]
MNQLHEKGEQVMSGDTFQMSTGQAHELALAFGRNGWTNADVEKLSEGNTAAGLCRSCAARRR